MGDRIGIEWTDATWNPVTGCTKVSAGCDHCYAETIAHRFAGTPAYPNGFEVTLHPSRLDQPLRWRRPRRVFVNSMSDLFHDDIPDEYIAHVFAVMALSWHHVFQILTKRPGRMRSLLTSGTFHTAVAEHMLARTDETVLPDVGDVLPLPNVWLGVSTEDQRWADIRIPTLLSTPAAVRFISAEPLLGHVELDDYARGKTDSHRGLDWVIVGGESGRNARPMHPQWARDLRDQCAEVDIPFLFKQWGEYQTVTPDHPDVRRVNDVLVDPENGRSVRIGDLGRTADSLAAPALFVTMRRVGKKAAGRMLDGQTCDGYPGVQS